MHHRGGWGQAGGVPDAGPERGWLVTQAEEQDSPRPQHMDVGRGAGRTGSWGSQITRQTGRELCWGGSGPKPQADGRLSPRSQDAGGEGSAAGEQPWDLASRMN